MSINWRTVDRSKLHPVFAADVHGLLERSPYSWVVTHGYRSEEEQRVLWEKHKAGGPKAAPPGKSAHNFGRAVDVVLDADPVKPGLQPDWNTDHAGWLWLFDAIWQHKRLHSGRSFSDSDHIEQLGWKRNL